MFAAWFELLCMNVLLFQIDMRSMQVHRPAWRQHMCDLKHPSYKKPNSKDTLNGFFLCLHERCTGTQVNFVQQFASMRERTRLQRAVETEPAILQLVQHSLLLANVRATAHHTGKQVIASAGKTS